MVVARLIGEHSTQPKLKEPDMPNERLRQNMDSHWVTRESNDGAKYSRITNRRRAFLADTRNPIALVCVDPTTDRRLP